ncbi:coagulation factor III, tissue factor a [Gouania willdenowi]|uniref:Tissue factor n=1 Tax=Gouania willdenowi TaxID=441366 RepID=A0A8C5HDV1_GOUWI|nr:tissue factor [Gouania willdenowi]
MMAFILILLFLCTHCVTGSYPRAQNVTWRSVNFKTVLTWEPKPSEEYSYTVEFSATGENKQRNHHCIRSSATVCDLSSSLTSLSSCYIADVLSEPPLGVTSDLIEFPHSSSPPFCPYKDTIIGQPDFRLQVSEDKRKTTLFVSDPLTALFQDGRQLNIRDVFNEQLQYKVTYRRNKSTGTKVVTSKTNVIELRDLDRGESYCFSVQAYIPSRTTSQQHGVMSRTQCSNDQDPSIFKVYSMGVIAGAIFLILLLIGILIAIVVVCCKHRKKEEKGGKEGVPLHDV